MVANTPLDCWTCRHMRERASGQYCAEFVRGLPGEGWRDLPCEDAYDTFCGGGNYQPTLSTRIARFLAGFK